MKIKNLFLITFAFVMIAFQSCSKKEEISEEFYSKIESSDNMNSSSRILSDEQIDSIAEYHNQILSEAFQNFDYTSSNLEEEFNNAIRATFINNIISEGLMDSFQVIYNSESIDSMLNDETVNSFIKNGKEIVEYNDNLSDIIDELNYSKSQAKFELSGAKLDLVLIYFAVLEKSSEFWLPTNKGGTGEGQEILTIIENNNINSGADYKVLASDGMAAACTFTSYGLLAGFTGPMGIGALMGTVAFSAAWSSGLTALGVG